MNPLLHQDLTQSELNQLYAFLTQPYPHVNPMNLNQAHGFITAIASAPNIIPPSHWQLKIFGGAVDFDSLEKALTITTLLQRLYHSILRQLELPQPFHLFLHEQANPIPLPQASSPLIAEWCDAYLQGAGIDDLWSSSDAGIDSLYPFALLAGHTSLLGTTDSKGKLIKDETLYKIKAAVKLPKHIKDIYTAWKIERSRSFAVWDHEEIGAYHHIHHGQSIH